MRQFLQKLLTRPLISLADRLSSRPDKKRVHAALSGLYKSITGNPGKNGIIMPFDVANGRFVVLSDQHKGRRNGADIFANAEKNYLAALDYYLKNDFFYINLGDSEELWENTLATVKRHNKNTFEHERKFLEKKAFVKLFGNHDLYWDNDPLAEANLRLIYGQRVTIYEGIILKTAINERPLEIYMTHGHQGDLQSDGNWFSKWFVSNVWGRVQAYLRINPNTPSTNDQLKTAHNRMMYEWSAGRKNTLLITGHTHQPVFKSFTQIELLYDKLEKARKNDDQQSINDLQAQIDHRHAKGDKMPDFTNYLDTYFNSGCCCFDDGDITGIEIDGAYIRLIKWKHADKGENSRIVLEESDFSDLKMN